jgi:hypothetical protein
MERSGSPVIYAMRPGETLEDAIRLAFTRFRRLGATDCVLELDEIAVPRAVAEAIAEELTRSPTVRSLELVHASAAARFVASLLSLRNPWVDVIVTEPRIEARLRTTPLPPPDRTTQPYGRDCPCPVAIELPSDCEPDVGLRLAFAEVMRRRLDAVALVLPPDREIPSDAVDLLLPQLSACLELRAFVLVHPSPTRAFLMSMLAQRLPHISFAGCASAEEARLALWRV